MKDTNCIDTKTLRAVLDEVNESLLDVRAEMAVMRDALLALCDRAGVDLGQCDDCDEKCELEMLRQLIAENLEKNNG